VKTKEKTWFVRLAENVVTVHWQGRDVWQYIALTPNDAAWCAMTLRVKTIKDAYRTGERNLYVEMPGSINIMRINDRAIDADTTLIFRATQGVEAKNRDVARLRELFHSK
jgi:hypothetical protein